MSQRGSPEHGPMGGHVDEMTGLLYVEGQLERARALEVSAHAGECPSCRTLLHALERESRLLTRAMFEDEESLPARLATVPGRQERSLQWVWAAAFGFAAMGLYALYTGYIEPWMQQLEQAGFGGTNLLGLVIFQGAFWKGWQSMLTLFEVLAMLTIVGFGVAFLRRRLRGNAALALVLGGLCAVAALPPAASATETRKGENVEVKQNETIQGDIFLFGNRARIDGTVDGDAFVFGSNVSVNGHVTGDLIGFGQSLKVSGKVDGNIRSFSNNLTISGEVGKNVTSFQETMNLDPVGKIGGSLTVFAKSLSLDGRLGRDLLVFSQHTDVSGAVRGEIRAKGESLAFSSTAEIGGPVRFEGNRTPDVASGAKLASAPEFHKLEHKPRYRQAHYYIWQIIWAAAFVLFGLALFLLMPSFSQESVKSAERFGASAGLGILAGIGLPIAAILACCTVVGLFVGISTLFVWYAALYYAQAVVGALVGEWLLGRTTEAGPLIGRMVLGLVLLRLATMIPYAGGFIKYGAAFWGLGAVSLAVYRRFQPALPVAPAAPLLGAQTA